MNKMKRKIVFLIGGTFLLVIGFFYSFKTLESKTICFTEEEMKNIWAGQPCTANNACTDREMCGILIGYWLCFEKNPNDDCHPACESGWKKNRRCDGVSGQKCEWWIEICDKGVDGYCAWIGSPWSDAKILVCMPLPFPTNTYPTCGIRTDCRNI